VRLDLAMVVRSISACLFRCSLHALSFALSKRFQDIAYCACQWLADMAHFASRPRKGTAQLPLVHLNGAEQAPESLLLRSRKGICQHA
jgi:hypothetical protein